MKKFVVYKNKNLVVIESIFIIEVGVNYFKLLNYKSIEQKGRQDGSLDIGKFKKYLIFLRKENGFFFFR